MIPVTCARVCALITVVSLCAPTVASSIVDFEDVTLGTTFGAINNQVPGQLVLTQNGIDVHIEEFIFGSTVVPGFAEVGGVFDPFFASTPLSIDNLNLRFEFQNVGFPVSEVSFEFVELGGLNNFAVNGGPIIQLRPLTTLPQNIAPGVTASVQNGTVTLSGDIDSFLVGGQELGIDNIVAIPEPATLALLTMGCAAICLHVRRRNPS